MSCPEEVVANTCTVHGNCIHLDTCDKSMCLLFFKPTTTFNDLKNAVREWSKTDTLQTFGRMNYGKKGARPTDVERFIAGNRSLFKTDLAYTFLVKIIFIAMMEVFDE